MIESETDPRRPPAPRQDDVAPGLPAIDGADLDTPFEQGVDLDVDDDEASALDDRTAGDLEGSLDGVLDTEPSGMSAEDDALAPVEADPTLAAGENERWTDGSDASEDTPWQEPAAAEPTHSSIDRGEEGFDDLAPVAGDALPGLPAAHVGDTNDEDADELDVSEASTFETARSETDSVPALPRMQVETRWHGPAREAARAIASAEGEVIAAARGLWRISTGAQPLALPFESEVSAVLVPHGGRTAWIANDAGEVWTYPLTGAPVRLPRPGTDDASVGGLELAAVLDVVVARTRGGALFRSHADGWTGPIVAKNVRRIRGSLSARADWLVAVVGSASAPELLATLDARTFVRLRGPEGEIVLDATRSGDVVAVASAGGRLFVSKDAGASYVREEKVIDVERVWALPSGVILAATFHEATDQGALVRVDGADAEVVLDIEAEVSRRRLSGPGEDDGDGRIHALAIARGALWVATGVGVFELALDVDSGPGEPE